MTFAPAPKAPKIEAPMVGRYRIIGRLGRGGMADILLALEHDRVRDFKRLVVIKRVIQALEAEDQMFVQMFLDEARLAARLNHPHIVQTIDVGDEGGRPYLAMEFLDGQSLYVLQHRAAALEVQVPVPVVMRVFCDVLEALDYAHELKDFDGQPLGVIHRDVTPSNIFVKYDGVTKLVDFGIAKSATQKEKTRAGVLKGKMAYMAPEQLRDAPITRSIDVWAMGIVLWETLAGERLFRGKNDFETVQNVMARDVPRLAARRRDVPEGLDVILGDVLSRDPALRTPTAEQFRARLEELAFKTQLMATRGDVARFMESLFAQAIANNRRTVQSLIERPPAEGQELLEVNDTGALEVKPEPVVEKFENPKGRPVAPPAPAARAATVDLYSEPTQVTAHPSQHGPAVAPIAPARANRTGPGAVSADAAVATEAPARPAWLVVAVLVALAVLGSVLGYLVAR